MTGWTKGLGMPIILTSLISTYHWFLLMGIIAIMIRIEGLTVTGHFLYARCRARNFINIISWTLHITLWDGHCYYPHFMDEYIGSQRFTQVVSNRGVSPGNIFVYLWEFSLLCLYWVFLLAKDIFSNSEMCSKYQWK